VYKDDGTFSDFIFTETTTGEVEVNFNRKWLWGSATRTETLPVLNGKQVTRRDWVFNDLYPSTCEEYHTLIGQSTDACKTLIR
jgi:hypothetical protein